MKLLFVVDSQNLWGAVRSAYGPNARVNYLKLKSIAKGDTTYEEVRYRAYIGSVDPDRASSFARVLKTFGYQVFALNKKNPRYSQTDWDAGIIVDVLNEIDTFDHLAIATGDGDFVPLIERVKEEGKLVRLVTLPKSTNPRLASICDEVRLLDKECVLWKRKDQNGQEF